MSERDNEQRTVPPDGRPAGEQLAWRKDFPIDWPQDHYVARRDFTKFLGLTSLAFVVGQFWIGVKSWVDHLGGKPGEKLVARRNQVPVGGSLVFHYPGEQDICLLLQPEKGRFLAYSQKCTHLSCAVVPAMKPELKDCRLLCPCHKGAFDLATGRRLAGPSRRPLPRITPRVRGEEIFATGVEENVTV